MTHKNTKIKKWIVLLFLSFIIVVIAVCVLVGSKLGTAKNGYKLLQEFATQPENAMTFALFWL